MGEIRKAACVVAFFMLSACFIYYAPLSEENFIKRLIHQDSAFLFTIQDADYKLSNYHEKFTLSIEILPDNKHAVAKLINKKNLNKTYIKYQLVKSKNIYWEITSREVL